MVTFSLPSSLLKFPVWRDDGNANEDVTWKYGLTFLELLRDYFNSFNLYKVVQLSRKRVPRNGVEVKTNNEKIPRRKLTFSTKSLIWSFHDAVLQRTGGNVWNFYNARSKWKGIVFLKKAPCFVMFSMPSPLLLKLRCSFNKKVENIYLHFTFYADSSYYFNFSITSVPFLVLFTTAFVAFWTF